MTHPKSHRDSVAESLHCAGGPVCPQQAGTATELTPWNRPVSFHVQKVPDEVGDDMRAVFKYLQGFSVWEAAALLSVPRISSVTKNSDMHDCACDELLGPLCSPMPRLGG